MVVEPPTDLPIGIMNAVLPTANVAPMSRYSFFCSCRLCPLNSSRVTSSPSSRRITAKPLRVSSAATTAPPAPVPTTTTSQVSV